MCGLTAAFREKLTTYSLDFCAFSRYTEEKGGNGVRIDKGVIKKLFVLIACCILFGWLVLDTARATALFSAIWNLISPFVVGAGIAFVFNVPMRAIERQLADLHRPGFRRALSIVLTILCMVLIIMFVIEMLIPQIQEIGRASCRERV